MLFMFKRRDLAARLIFLAGLTLTLLLSWGLWQQNENAARKQFTLQAEGVVHDIDVRLREHQQILFGGAGLFEAGFPVGRQEWRKYIARLRLSEKYPGNQGVGYSQAIRPVALQKHISRIRAEGYSAYTVHPPGKRGLYTPIVYLEPFSGRNLAAFGYDMFSEATRRKAMSYAVDHDRTTISGKVKLAQETQDKPQAGFQMYVPVYHKNMPVATPAVRWKALQGFVISSFRMSDLMRGILGGVNSALDFVIHDGTESSVETQMYLSAENHAPDPLYTPRFSLQRQLATFGHVWTITLHSRPAFEAQFRPSYVLLVLLLGGGVSALFALTTSLNNRSVKAQQLAEQMTAQIRESVQQFKTILECSPTAVRIATEGGHKVMFSNRRYAEMMNASPAQVEGREPSTYYADGSVYEDMIARLGRGESIIDHMVELKVPGKVRRWSLASYLQIQYDKQPAVLGWYHDITDLKAAETLLQHERDFGNALFGAASAIMLVLDRQGRIVRFNAAAEAVTGYHFDEVRGKLFWEFFTLPEEKAGVVAVFNSLEVGSLVARYENRWLMRDGSQRLFDWSNAELWDAEGKVEYIVSVGIDISQRKQAEATLREQAALTSAILENVVDGIITIDSLGNIASFNKAAESMFGYGTEEVVGKNVNVLMPEPHHSNHDGYLRNYMSTGVARIIGIGREVEGRRKDGSLFPMDLAVSEISEQGKRMFIGLVRDITERKRVDRMKSEFVSTVSHELRTPLTAIRGSLGLITGGMLGALPEQVKSMLSIASNNTERLLMLINDILDMQKIEAGKMSFRFENVFLMKLLETAIADLSTYDMQHKVRFVISHRVDDACVVADRDRLMQVLANLMSNAAKFSPPGSTVEISVARQNENRLRISVSDVGPGIPEAFKSSIFRPFSQSDSSDTRSKGGTGLGLAITRAIVERHGGIIGFVSHVGVGTTFYVDLNEIYRGGDNQSGMR